MGDEGQVYLTVPGEGQVPVVSIMGADGKYRLGVHAGGTPDGVIFVGVPGHPAAKLVTCGGRLGVDIIGVEGGEGTPGLSAYQVAVENGFEGTEVEWLASLVGAPGNDGLPGNDGAPGIQGEQGLPGNDGAPGLQGVPGAKGDTGEPGLPGADGAQGIQGIQGLPGSDASVTKANVEAVLTGVIASHSHAGGGGVPIIYVPIAVPVLAALAWTNMPAALSFWLSTATVAKGVTRVDMTGYTQVRLLVNKQATAGAAASKLILRYKLAPFTQAVANYSDIGTSEVSVAVNVQNSFLDTGWINLAEGAKADVFLALMGSGGDGTLDPAFGYVTAVFK